MWGLAAAAAVFWGVRLWGPSASAPAHTQIARQELMPAGDLTRLLGAAPVRAAEAPVPQPDAASRFVLTGVVATPGGAADRAAAPGVALIAVDGKPSQAYRVGDALAPPWRVESVDLRSVRLAQAEGAPSLVLRLPPPAPPATGVPGRLGPAPGAEAAPPLYPAAAPMMPPAAPEGTPPGAARFVPPTMTPPPGATSQGITLPTLPVPAQPDPSGRAPLQ